jgi:DNA-binding NarL/FixJ family response regulator
MKKRAKAKQRILIVDSHPMMRQGLARLIDREPDPRYAIRWTEVQNAR